MLKTKLHSAGSALVLMAALCAPWASTAAPVAKPVPIEAFFTPSAFQQARLSPDGRWMAAATAEPGQRRRLVMIDLDGKEPAKVIAAFSRADVESVKWINNEWLTFDTSDVEDRFSHKKGSGLLSVSRDGEKIKLLIRRGYEKSEASTMNQALDPNHYVLHQGAPGGTEIIVGEMFFDANGEFDHLTPRYLNVATGVNRTYLKEAPPHPNVQRWLFDNQGLARGAVAYKNDQYLYYWRDTPESKWRELAKFPARELVFWPLYIDANGDLMVSSLDQAGDLDELRRFDFSTSQPEKEPLVSTPGFDAVAERVMHPLTGQTLGLRVETDAQSTYWFSPKMTAIQAKVDAMLQGRVNLLQCGTCEDPDRVLVFSYSDKVPGDYLLFSPKTNQWQRLGNVATGIDPDQMGSMSFHRFKARDGLSVPVWITRPPQSDPKVALPTVVLVHGGPWVRGQKWNWDAQAQFLASRGYLVVEPEFRGSSGFGEKLSRAGWKQWGQAMQDDVSDALQFAAEQGWADKSRACIAGGSYGGYATLMGLAKYPDQFRCGVAWVAVSDPLLLYTVHWSDASDESKKYSMPDKIGDPVKDAAMLKANSPLNLAAKIKAPVMLAYGARDQRVPLVHGEKMRDALKNAGNPPEWIVYDDEGHVWRRPKT
ncbi:alpha/beta hydrolase family protein, partial [Ideonella sp.]|uniref:alpha/beta hydrolase family protein n=1 Tax=Ideonella sp. TaxID=1929293 RepID=UPI003BB6550B